MISASEAAQNAITAPPNGTTGSQRTTAAEVAEGDDEEDAEAVDQDQHAPTSAAPPMT
jgi:hypothetical protein